MNLRKCALLLFIAAIHAPAEDAQAKIKKDDVPKNEKQMWKRITKSQKDIEENLMSGDPRFTAELDLARRKVADLMLDAEGDKKNKAVVHDLSRCWNYWVRETDEIVTEDLKEYNLATAAGKSFDPADNNPQGGNPYIGAPIQYQQAPAPQAYYVEQPPPTPNYAVQPEYVSPAPSHYVSSNGVEYPSIEAAKYAGAPEFRNGGDNVFVQIGIALHAKKPDKQTQRPGSAYRGDGKKPAPATHAVVVARATGRK